MGCIERINEIANESPGKRHTMALANLCALIENMKSGSEDVGHSVIGHTFVQTDDIESLVNYSRYFVEHGRRPDRDAKGSSL